MRPTRASLTKVVKTANDIIGRAADGILLRPTAQGMESSQALGARFFTTPKTKVHTRNTSGIYPESMKPSRASRVESVQQANMITQAEAIKIGEEGTGERGKKTNLAKAAEVFLKAGDIVITSPKDDPGKKPND